MHVVGVVPVVGLAALQKLAVPLPVLGDPFGFVAGWERDLTQAGPVHADLPDAKTLARCGLPVEDNSPGVEVEIVTAENALRQRRGQVGNAAVRQGQHAQVSAEVATAVNEVSVVVT